VWERALKNSDITFLEVNVVLLAGHALFTLGCTACVSRESPIVLIYANARLEPGSNDIFTAPFLPKDAPRRSRASAKM
jgi:hypothetical protein